MVEFCQMRYEAREALCLRDASLQIVTIPALGGKIISVKDLTSGYEFMWRQPDRALTPAPYDAVFTDYDISGWDECFPTINPAPYPAEPWQGTVIADHGEIWQQPWRWRADEGGVMMWVHGVRLPYHFERRLSLPSAGTLRVDYRAENLSPYSMPVLWSMHPFFNITPQTRILVPEGAQIIMEASDGGHLGGFLAKHTWPHVITSSGEPLDLSRPGPPRAGSNYKLYTGGLEAGWAALWQADTGNYACFTFDRSEIPYVGVCALRGAWPDRGQEAYTVILEPCKGWPDAIDIASQRGASFTLAPHASCTWHVELHLGNGRTGLERLIGEIPD